jgi:hypothetical protein
MINAHFLRRWPLDEPAGTEPLPSEEDQGRFETHSDNAANLLIYNTVNKG